MNIFDKNKNKSKNFTKVADGKDRAGVRAAEEALLKPEGLPKYDGKKPKNKSELASRTALIVFKDKKQQKLIGELFSIRTSINSDMYITDISLLHNIALAVRNGTAKVVGGEIIMVDPPDFTPLTVEQLKQLSKKKRKKYRKMLKEMDVTSMEIFQAKYFPDAVKPKPKPKRRRRKIG